MQLKVAIDLKVRHTPAPLISVLLVLHRDGPGIVRAVAPLSHSAAKAVQ